MTMMTQHPPGHPQPHRFTRAEYYQMLELGFFAGHRVELIEGEIIEMAAMKDLHAVALGIAAGTLARAFPGHWVRNQLPLTLVNDTEPEPDLAVVAGMPRDYKGKGHPTTALLVVEIADTSLRFDRGEMASIYARAGVMDYWILNLVDSQIEVHRDPEADAAALFGFKYRTIQIWRLGESVTPLAAPGETLAVADLLP